MANTWTETTTVTERSDDTGTTYRIDPGPGVAAERVEVRIVQDGTIRLRLYGARYRLDQHYPGSEDRRSITVLVPVQEPPALEDAD